MPYGTGGPGSTRCGSTRRSRATPASTSTGTSRRPQLAEPGKFDLVFIVDSQFITPDSPPHYLNRLEPLTLLSRAGHPDQAHRPGRHRDHDLQHPVQPRPPARLARPDQRRPRRAGTSSPPATPAPPATTASTSTTTTTPATAGRWSTSSSPGRCGTPTRTTRSCATGRPGVFLDPDKQHALDHEGELLLGRAARSTCERSPQGQPVIFQAGDSDQGRDLGASVGEGIFTHAPDIPQRPGVLRRHQGPGPRQVRPRPRPPRDHAGRQDRRRRHRRGGPRDRGRQQRARPHASRRRSRSSAGRSAGTTSRQYDLDAPFPVEALEHGERSFYTQAKKITQRAAGQRLDAAPDRRGHPAASARASSSAPPRRSPTSSVEWWEARACDGFNIGVDHPANFRRFVDEVVPILPGARRVPPRVRARPRCADISACPSRTTATPPPAQPPTQRSERGRRPTPASPPRNATRRPITPMADKAPAPMPSSRPAIHADLNRRTFLGAQPRRRA